MTSVTDQPAPTPSDGPAVWDMAREDLRVRYAVVCRSCRTRFVSHASATRFCSDMCMFLGNVKPTAPSECWTWRQAKKGYRAIQRARGRSVLAHRFAYELFWGAIPDGHVVRHMCDNPPCVNPFHLVTGTDAANASDMVTRRRQAHAERHPAAKLSTADVIEIRASAGVSVSELARKHKVSRAAIRHARDAQTWRYVDADMQERDRLGRERYGTPLQPHNGRDALVDAYQEALDLVVYLRQAIEERARGLESLSSSHQLRGER